MITAFGLIDVPATAALAISIQLGLAGLALGIVGGLVWVLLPEKTPKRRPNARHRRLF
jgi:hypothetical protein